MARNLSVLLVEDDDPLRSVLTDLLAAWGWSVFPTGMGQEAIQLARTRPIDFTIVDLHLPGMTGLDVLRTIQREIRQVPTIMMSGQASAEETRAALAAGVFRFLRKPIDLDDLRTTVGKLIQTHFGLPPSSLGGHR